MFEVTFRSPIEGGDVIVGHGLQISDETAGSKSRVVGGELNGVAVGHARRTDTMLTYSTSPGEWTVLGEASHDLETIDLTHVRAVIRLTGPNSVHLLVKVCSLDFGDHMFPNGSAARTSVAGTATEVVRDDHNKERSYLLVTSRSLAAYLHKVLVDQAAEYSVPST